jgi:ABC-type phosphate transport system substrate-binding protein
MPRLLSPTRRLRLVQTIVALLSAAFVAPRAVRAQVAVVVNPANAVDELTTDKLRRLYLGQARTFPSGEHARLGRHSGSAGVFDRAALGLQSQIVRSRWMAMIFRGEATAIPTELASADDVKRFVRAHPDAIAFLPLAQVDGSVKVLTIDGKRPDDAGYVIH